MELIVFDLDGTLARTTAVDGELFVEAVTDRLGVDLRDADWTAFQHVSDSGIIDDVFAEHLHRAPSPGDVRRVVDRFMELLERRQAKVPASFVEVPGAAALLASLRDHATLATAIATGGWERPATFKLQVAGLDVGWVPKAFAEDGPSRERIVGTAIERASRAHGGIAFDRIVSVGDATWDLKTARSLGLPFVGIASGERASVLRELGTRHVLEDYLDPGAFLRAVEEAVPLAD